MKDRHVTCVAPINIAVIKYWGKSNEDLNIPLNSSLSVTLKPNDLCTTTTISFSTKYEEDCFNLNGGVTESVSRNKRLQRCLTEARRLYSLKREAIASANNKEVGDDDDLTNCRCFIKTRNNFPTAAGLASSASGYACLAKCLGTAFGLETDLSILARLGSGSATRSMHGGFVKWNKGESSSGVDSCAIQIADSKHWPELKVVVLIVNNKQKSVPSTAGMRRSVQTSDLLKFRVDHIVEDRLKLMEEAVIGKDFRTFAEITMKESNQLHAICQDTYPPIIPPYMNATSHHIAQLVTEYNKPDIRAAYTFDAGANALLFTLEENLQDLLATFGEYFPPDNDLKSFYGDAYEDPAMLARKVKKIEGMDVHPCSIERLIVTEPGRGAYVVETGLEDD